MTERINGDYVHIRKWLIGIIIGVAGSVMAGVIAFDRVRQKVDLIPVIQNDITTYLGVLKDHGTELEGIRIELRQLRGVDAQNEKRLLELEKQMNSQTADRWFKDDHNRYADMIDKRLTRIEDQHDLIMTVLPATELSGKRVAP